MAESTWEADKRAAAAAAVALVEDGMVVGLGTGSTATHVIELLAARVASGLRITGVATSRRTEDLARRLAIPLTTLDELGARPLDLAIDGADEIDPELRLIKGAGGALLYEKLVAGAARAFIVVADARKDVPCLGTTVRVPVEVIPFGRALVERRLRALGGEPRLRLGSDGAPYVTDAGHQIFDVALPQLAEDPAGVAQALDVIPGLVEHGLFIDVATRAFIGHAGHVVSREPFVRRSGPTR